MQNKVSATAYLSRGSDEQARHRLLQFMAVLLRPGLGVRELEDALLEATPSKPREREGRCVARKRLVSSWLLVS